MAQADVLALVQTLSAGLADPVLADQFYDEQVRLWGAMEWLVQVSVVSVAPPNQATAFPDAALDLLAVTWDDTELYRADLYELEAMTPRWRDTRGTPAAYTIDREDARTFRLWPYPETTTGKLSFPHGAPLGQDFPAYAVGVVYTEPRQDVLPWMELPLALLICAREFARDSDHTNVEFAAACQRFATGVIQVVGAG